MLWCEENAEWGRTPQPLLWLGSCAVGGKSRKHIRAQPSHTFILLRIHRGPSACARRTGVHAGKCQLMHINKAWQPDKTANRQGGFSTVLSASPLEKKKKKKADMQHSLNNSSLIYRRTIHDRLGFSAYCMSTFGGCALLSVTLTAGIIPARSGMLHGPSSGCHSKRFKSVWIFLIPLKDHACAAVCTFTTEEPLDTFRSSASQTTKATVHDDHRYRCPIAKFCRNDDLRWVQSTLSACGNGRWDFDSRAVIGFQ